MQETEWIKRIRQKDETAFGELFDAYKNKALRTACFIAGNLADGEDIVQETFVKCYLNITSLKNDAYFASWFYQILTRTAWEVVRKRKRETPVAEIFPEEGEGEKEPSSLEVLMQEEESSVLYQQIQKLDIKHRTAVILYYYNEMSVKEIAEIMDCFEGTVKSRLHTARKLLKKSIEQEEKWEAGVYPNAKYKSV